MGIISEENQIGALNFLNLHHKSLYTCGNTNKIHLALYTIKN